MEIEGGRSDNRAVVRDSEVDDGPEDDKVDGCDVSDVGADSSVVVVGIVR